MYCTKKITSDLIWLGGSDRRLALFENVYPIPRGVSYNAYLIQDEKTALLDTVDQAIAERFFENLEHALQGYVGAGKDGGPCRHPCSCPLYRQTCRYRFY